MPRTHQQQADRWGCPLSTWRRYIGRGAPCGNDKKFYQWVLNLQRTPDWAKTSERMAAMGYKPKSKMKQRAKMQKESDAEESKEKSAHHFRDFYRDKLNEAIELNDQEGIKFYNEHYLKIDESIRKTELHAKKLGLEDGTTLSRLDAERILRAAFYAGNACIQGVLTTKCQQWADIHDPAELYESMKPQLVFATLFSGFSKVETAKGAPNIPDWVSECVRQEQKQYITFDEDE